MKQFAYDFYGLTGLEEILEDFLQHCPEQYADILVQVFTCICDREIVTGMVGKIAAVLPQAKIIGTVTSELPVIEDWQKRKTQLCIMVFRDTQVKLHSFARQAQEEEQAWQRKVGQTLAGCCQETQHLAGLELLVTAETFAVRPFLQVLAEKVSDVPVFGGGAYAAVQEEVPFVFSQEGIVDQGILVAAFFSRKLKILVADSMGWRPLGKTMTITEMVDDYTVAAIDHKPAAHVYEKYLGVDREDFHSFNVSEFPLLVEREGYLLARPSIGRTDADALTFAADLQTGEKVRLSYGDPQAIIQQALHTGQQVQAFGPEGILLISCVGRHFYVGEAEKLEIEWYRKIAPTAVCHTYGEFLRQGRNINTLTITFVAVAFCEDVGKRQERKRAVDSLANQDFQGHLSMVHRLAHFVTVSSQEQEALAAQLAEVNDKLAEANKRLSAMASMDRLTQLLNRGEVEQHLQELVRQSKEQDRVFAGILLDIDNFKKINDTFGHDVGDRVLIRLAEVLRSCVRSHDYAGRWGGDEFLVLLPDTAAAYAAEVGERIRAALREAPVLPDGGFITVSAGVAQIQANETFPVFYQRLDKALYEAKHTGKDRVVTAG